MVEGLRELGYVVGQNLVIALGLLAAPLTAEAQQPTNVPRIGDIP